MTPIIDIFHAERLLEIRETAMAQLRPRCPGLRRADLVRLDATRWIDVLVWDDERAAEVAMEQCATIPALAEMHELIGRPTSHERGTVAHCV